MSRRAQQRGSALVMVLLVVSMLFAVASALLFQTTTERVVAMSEQDHMKALQFAEAGLAWSRTRILGSSNFTTLLAGPDGDDTADNHLLGLRDLSLTGSDDFTHANEWTASAIVQRDFGEGTRSWEVVRLLDGDGTRGLAYVRVDDNYDDDPADPANNDPLTDTDGRITATVVAEYPVFVGTAGVEVANLSRSRARRTLRGTFAAGDSPPAILIGGDAKLEGHLSLCGNCASIHANGYLFAKDVTICGDATSSGTFTPDSDPIIAGQAAGGQPTMEIPVVNPYDTAYVPAIDVFDTTALNLPSELKCGEPSAADPGNAKYFAFVADDLKGLIFKAYWSAGDARWEWKLIDDLSDATNVMLDDCGRTSGDASYGTGVDDGKEDEFYGWKLDQNEDWDTCPACGTAGDDATLCDLANNDFGVNGYYDATTGSLVSSVSGSTIPAFPGSFAPDGQLDLQPQTRHKDSLWKTVKSEVFSPLYNAVIFFYGNAKLDQETAKPGKDYCSSSGCTAGAPASKWMASLIAYGDIDLNKVSYHGPANPNADYRVQFIAGRDIKSGNKQNELLGACDTGCSTAAPADIDSLGGLMAAHEQVELTSAAQYFGTILVEDASVCSNLVDYDDGHLSKLKDMDLFYDCEHPTGPSAELAEMQRWQEVD